MINLPTVSSGYS